MSQFPHQFLNQQYTNQYTNQYANQYATNHSSQPINTPLQPIPITVDAITLKSLKRMNQMFAPHNYEHQVDNFFVNVYQNQQTVSLPLQNQANSLVMYMATWALAKTFENEEPLVRRQFGKFIDSLETVRDHLHQLISLHERNPPTQRTLAIPEPPSFTVDSLY